MSWRKVAMQSLITMGTMFVLNTVAESAGGGTRRFIRGERSIFERIFGP